MLLRIMVATNFASSVDIASAVYQHLYCLWQGSLSSALTRGYLFCRQWSGRIVGIITVIEGMMVTSKRK